MDTTFTRFLKKIKFLALAAFLVAPQVNAQIIPVTRIFTDYNPTEGRFDPVSTGVAWDSDLNTNENYSPRNQHHLLGFEWNGTTYATGIDDAKLPPGFTPGKYQALPVGDFNPTSGGQFLFLQLGELWDGVPNGLIGDITDNNIPPPFSAPQGVGQVLTYGTQGLDLGSAFTNIPESDPLRFAITGGITNTNAIGDAIPDIVVTQTAEPGGKTDRIWFEDASGNVVGTEISVTFETTTHHLGNTYSDFFNPTNGNGMAGGNFINGERQLRMIAFDAADFSITSTNSKDAVTLVYQLGGSSDVAFIAYNTDLLELTIANNDEASTPIGIPVTIDILANDNPDTQDDLHSYTVPPTTSNGGTIEINPDGTITYTPAPGFTGLDQFQYTICSSSTSCATATVRILVENPGLTLLKSSDFDKNRNFAEPGELITYTFLATNTGNVELTNVNISDTLPGLSAITYVSSTDPDTLEGTLSPGESATYTATYTVTAADASTGSVTNTARLTGTPPVGDPIELPSNTIKIPVEIASPSLAIVKSANVTSVAAEGDVIIYTFLVTNDGNMTITDIVVSDAMVGLSAVQYTAGSSTKGSVQGTLLRGESATYTATYTVTQADIDAGKNIINMANVTGTSPKGTSIEESSNEVIVTVGVESPNLSIVKSADVIAPATVAEGDVITYTFVVANNSNVTFTNVVVSDAMAGLSAIAYTVGSSTEGSANGTLIPGESAIYTATYTVTQADIDAGGNITNTAKVTGTLPGGDSIEQPSNTVKVPVENASPSISLIKTGVYASETRTITYTFTVINTGNVTVTNITVNDPILGGALSGSIASLAPGETDNTTFIVDYSVTQDDLDLGHVINSAIATGEDPDGNPVKDTSGTDKDNDTPTETDLNVIQPEAIDDNATTNVGIPVTIPVLDNDITHGADFIIDSIEIIDQPKHGTIEITTDGKVIYTPDPNYVGEDIFTYKVKDSNGQWTNVATVNITITTNELFIPNVITPNDDGINDTFEIVGLENYRNAQVLIYNRWGNQVYRNDQYTNMRGFSGEGLNKGTYFYVIKLTDNQGQVHNYEGWVYIKE